jgi:hypothetical protein
MPASTFNIHDDFQTYLPRLVRMLETGSVGGNPFDAIGVDSLGAQAFMQSFFFKYLSISYVNAFDLIACFVLCLLLLREIWLKQKNHWIFLLVSLVVFVVINPMYVNVSSLYSGSLMILGTVYASLVFSDYMRSAEYKRLFAGILLVSLFLSSLVSLKLTFVFFAVTYFAAYYGLSLLFSENKSRMLLTASFAGLTAIIFITPWILVSLPNYLSAAHLTLTGEGLPVTGDRDGLFLSNISAVFSFKKSSWGGYYLGYSLIALLLGIMGLLSFIRLIKSGDRAQLSHLVTVSAACFAAVVSFVVNVYLFDPGTAVRYSIPVLIPVASVTLMMPWIKQHTPQAHSQNGTKQLIGINAPGVTLILAVVLISGLFSHDLVDRINRAYQQRTQISFPINNGYIRYNEAALGKSTADWVYALQHKIDAGSAIFAMMSVPFHLDYARNPVFFYTESGILNPWFAVPLSKHPEETRKYLSDSGIQYVMYEYRGLGMKHDLQLQGYLGSPYWMYRDIGERSIKFRAILRYLSENSLSIYHDGEIVILDIDKRKSPPPTASPTRK